MSGAEIDKLCRDWLAKNYGEELASEYSYDSLVNTLFNNQELSEALKHLSQVLEIAFPGDTFGTVDYHNAREKLGLCEEEVNIADIFISALHKDRSGADER